MPNKLLIRRALAACALLLHATGTQAVEIGDREEKVYAELGEPNMLTDLGGQGKVLAYPRGTVYLRDGKVVKCDLMTATEAADKASREIGEQVRLERRRAFKESRMAVLFNPLSVEADTDPSEVRITRASVQPAYVDVPVFNYEERDTGYHYSPRGDSMQSIGGGGSVSPGGISTVRVRVPPYTAKEFVGVTVSWVVTKKPWMKFKPDIYLVNFYDRTAGKGEYFAVPPNRINGLPERDDWTVAKLSTVVPIPSATLVERAFSDADGLLIVPAKSKPDGGAIVIGCEGTRWLPASRDPTR